MTKIIYLFTYLLMGLWSSNLFAQSTYSICSDTQTNQLLQQFQNQFKDYRNNEEDSYIRCLVLNDTAEKYLLAISQPTPQQTGDYTEYNLNLYLLDRKQNKRLSHYQYTDGIVSDADRFEAMYFDISPYSTLAGIDVVGLRLQHGHLGGISYELHRLYLFKIEPQQPIKLVLEKFITDASGGMSVPECDGSIYTKTKRHLILAKSQHHGLQDIIINEKTNRTAPNDNNCQFQQSIQKRSHKIYFNGQQYLFEHLNFLDYGI